jgi:hypothetical protein
VGSRRAGVGMAIKRRFEALPPNQRAVVALAGVGLTAYVVSRFVRPALGAQEGTPKPIVILRVAPGEYLSISAAIAFYKMKAAAKRDGVTLHVNSGFRSWGSQGVLWAEHKAAGVKAYVEGNAKSADPIPPTALPGHSNHQLGLSVDIESAGGTNAAYKWLVGNAKKFGFVNDVAVESWHWTFKPAVLAGADAVTFRAQRVGDRWVVP